MASFLNKYFICIKVDREERPDIDHIYMDVCQALTGHGGWPLSIFMTADKKPFYAGTYFPRTDRMGMPGFLTLLDRIRDAWENKRNELFRSAESILEAISRAPEAEPLMPGKGILHEAYNQFKYEFDSVYGGFGGAPKFPSPHNLLFLLRYWHTHKESSALEMVEKTLDAMHRGGIYDHIGFGFSRYSTDRKWLVPHFEKMLYDNALLAMAYLEAYQATGKREYAAVAEQVFNYVLRDMTAESGGFYSAEDADSEGVEGKFYVWSLSEVKDILGERHGNWFCKYYDITEAGNFEGHNIPNLIRSRSETTEAGKESLFVEECREQLFAYRERRVHPYKDDKILTSWNGLMIAAMAMGGRILQNDRYTEAAERAVSFLLQYLLREDGRLMARFRDGQAAFPAYADDYAFLVWGLIELYETTYNPRFLEQAIRFNEDMRKYFWDEKSGGFFIYGSDSEQLITRPKEIYDGAMPSSNSTAALNHIRLARLTSRPELEEMASRIFSTFGTSLENVPRGYAFMLTAFMYAQAGPKELVLVAETPAADTEDRLLKAAASQYNPFMVSIYYSKEHQTLEKLIPSIVNYKSVGGQTTAYLCENYTCGRPVTDPDTLGRMLQ